MNLKHKELHRVALTAIIYKGNEYLIVKRSPDKKAFPEQWTVPGGGLEVDDYINTPKTTEDSWYFAVTESLRREVKEEVGVEVEDFKYLLDITFIRGDGIPVVILSYYCPWKSGEVKLDEENIDYKWVTFKEAKDYDLIPGILGEIEMVDKILKGEHNIRYNYNSKG